MANVINILEANLDSPRIKIVIMFVLKPRLAQKCKVLVFKEEIGITVHYFLMPYFCLFS